jgi:CRISPR type III-A-associated RAMP protein Csm4
MPRVILKPTGAFHVGLDTGDERQKVLAYVPSDTLFSAMMVTWAQAGRADEVVKQFAGRPPFALTSAFPCLLAQDDPLRAVVRLLPLPLVRLPDDDALPPKKKKRLRWVSWGVFEKLCQAEPLTGELADENFLQGGKVWLLAGERQEIAKEWKRDPDAAPWWKENEVVPRVALDRATNASNLFHTGRVTLAQGVGLWFALEGAELGRLTPLIESALAQLADSGLGGLRSTGHGAFVWNWDPHPGPACAPRAGEGAFAVTLARYAPRDADEAARALQPRGASYQLTTVAGWCQDDALHPWRRRRVRMVTEGSVIGWPGAPASASAGALVDVRPTQEPARSRFTARGVYRYGYAFPVGVRREALREAADG